MMPSVSAGSRSAFGRRGAVRSIVVGILLVHLGLVLHGATRHSLVFDEIVYAPAGYAYLTTGDYRMNPEHPPLLKLWTGASWLGTGLPVEIAPGWIEGNQWRFGKALFFGAERDWRSLVFRARAMVALLSAVLGLAVFRAAARAAGDLAGLGALALYAFDPLVIAHAGLATTDLGATALFFLAVLAIGRAMQQVDWRSILLAGAAIGLALASKFSTVVLLPVLGLAAIRSAWRSRGDRTPAWWRPLVGAIAVGAVATGVLFACYGPAGPGRYLEGVQMLRGHLQAGRMTYAFGLYSGTGWWWYFPAAWAVKTPLPSLLLGLLGLGSLVFARRVAGLRFLLLVAPAVVLVSLMTSTMNLGVRHALPLTPFFATAGGLAVARFGGRRWWRSTLVAGLLAWLLVGTASVHPEEIAYSNELAGGPARTWHHLADSNVDWGQSLPALAEVVGREPLRRLYLSYFGTAEPDASGLSHYRSIPGVSGATARHEAGPDLDGREWIAISVTNLLEVYSESRDGYAWLRERAFTAFPGFSIAVFDVTGDADAHRRVGETALGHGDSTAAESAFRRAVELDPRDGSGWFGLAKALGGLGRWPEALGACEEARMLLRGEPEIATDCREFRARSTAAVGSEPVHDEPVN